MAIRSSGPDPGGDPLSEVLHDLRLERVSYARCSLAAPWSLRFDAQGPARFHFVGSGGAWLRAPDGSWSELGPGTVVLLPRGCGHQLSDRRRRTSTSIDEMPRKLLGADVFGVEVGGAGPTTVLFCGSIELAEPNLHPLIALMPPVLELDGAMAADTHLLALLHAMTDEVEHLRIGRATVLTRLAEALVTRVIRQWVEQRAVDTTGWLAAIRDPEIGRALASVHARPGGDWTLESLARVAGLSRSVFSERFTALVGVPPARYLARWRMHLASNRLKTQGATVAELARELGYASEPAFSRAFKRALGVTPSSLRAESRRSRKRSEQ